VPSEQGMGDEEFDGQACPIGQEKLDGRELGDPLGQW